MTTTIATAQVMLTSIAMTDPCFDTTRWHDRNSVHRAIMSLYPTQIPQPARSNANILFRIEPEHLRVLVQSTVAPVDSTNTRPLSPILDTYQAGIRITLLADINATRTVNRTSNGQQRTHRAHYAVDDIPGWFERRLSDTLADLTFIDIHRTYSSAKNQAKLAIDRVRAHATIIDPDQFRHHTLAGVGRAKAYGCGLISSLPLA